MASGTETALFSLSKPQVRACAQSTDPRRRQIAQLLQRPRDLMVTLLMVNIAMNILVQDVIANLTENTPSWWISVGVPLALTVLFGELLPKSVALSNQLRIGQAVAPLVSFLAKALSIVRKPLVQAASWISHLLFSSMRPSAPLREEELEYALGVGSRAGVLTAEEREVCEGALELNTLSVRNLMTPAPELQVYEIQEPLTKLFELIEVHGRSRIPVVKGSLDGILGILEASVLFSRRPSIQQGEDLLPFLTPPHFLPEVSQARDALEMMLDKRLSMLFVVDEYGSINGLVTRDDLVQCIFGVEEEEQDVDVQKVGFHACIATGRAEVADIEELFQIKLPNEHHRLTLGGWLTDQMQMIPAAGAEWHSAGLAIQVLAAEPTHVVKLYVRFVGS